MSIFEVYLEAPANKKILADLKIVKPNKFFKWLIFPSFKFN